MACTCIVYRVFGSVGTLVEYILLDSIRDLHFTQVTLVVV